MPDTLTFTICVTKNGYYVTGGSGSFVFTSQSHVCDWLQKQLEDKLVQPEDWLPQAASSVPTMNNPSLNEDVPF